MRAVEAEIGLLDKHGVRPSNRKCGHKYDALSEEVQCAMRERA